MRRRIVVALALTATVLAVGAARHDGQEEAEAHHQRPEQQRNARGETVAAAQHRPGCDTEYRRKRMYVYAKARYMRRDRPFTEGQSRYVRHVAWCLPTREGTRWAFGKRDQWRAKFRSRLAYQRLTPYGPCYGGRWATPCEIIGGESGGSWSATNGSCVGPYQFCGWSVPWPVDSWADKLAHHRQAAYLWNGGAGCSNWTATSSSC